MQLVIVESPAKAKTIEKYLGKDFTVLASYGHIRDLPPKDGSVRPDEDFAMDWELYGDKTSRVKAITDAAKTADRLILATDPDREGEAISWHVRELLAKRKALPKDVQRVTFNAITKEAVTTAMGQPRELDQDLIDAYMARRALDYLFGFTLSPVLWRKLPGAKSAGRVQSVALRLICQREHEIELFRPQEYWSVSAQLEHDGTAFTARMVKFDGEKLEKLSLGDQGTADRAKAAVEGGAFRVEEVDIRPTRRNPWPPFTTSTLQMEAARKLGFSAAHTMRVAQTLYEAGAITYMRTDGVQMDHSAISAARKTISERYSNGHYLPEKPRHYETKAKNAQEAHEAIRPTEFSRDHFGSGDEARLYELIWKRAIASQMASANIERTTVTLREATGRHELRATGQVIKFPGFLAVYDESLDQKPGDDEDESGLLPVMAKGDSPAKRAVDASQHFTQPPPRYSEATLVKRLEELGIGRPSTYAATIQVLKDRNYVRTEKNRFFAEESGRLLTAFLERFFPRYVAYDFTAGMEEELDDVSGGRAEWKSVLAEFWKDFKPKSDEVMGQKPSEVTEALDEYLSEYLFPAQEDGGDPRKCPNCGSGRLALRGGRFGAFVACSNYPECKFTRKFAQPGGAGAEADGELGKHPETGEPVMRKVGRFGPYVELGSGKEAKRSSIPKDIGELDLDWAVKLLSLPRTVGNHPESGEPITASLGRYGPYLAHQGKYAKLRSTAEIFETGMNSAVAKLAEAAAGGGRGARTAAEPLKTFGPHPESGGEMKLMAGRYGPYVTDGTTNATLPRDKQPWKADEVAKLRVLAGKGKGLKEIAKALNRSEESTKERAKIDGIGVAKLR